MRTVLVLGQVLNVEQHGVLLRPQLVSYQQVGHQLGAQSWKKSKESKSKPCVTTMVLYVGSK